MSVISRYKATLEKSSAMLHEIKKSPKNLTFLLELQSLLIRQIKNCERNIRRLKLSSKELKVALGNDRRSKEKAQEVKKKIQHNTTKRNEYNQLIYLWKCFGDGIAYLYLDKYALKHTFYSVEDYSPKETPGFITGKSGFRLEWKIIKKVIAKGWPILLCDITNVIRHGDVCALFGPDPLLIEVKSSKNTSKRVDRQLQHLEQLSKFYQEDGADDFRGVPNVRRKELVNPEINYSKALNDCINQSYTDGMATSTPEPGVHYVCLYNNFDPKKLEKIVNDSSIIYFLNETKSNGDWLYYYPFTLSIQLQHLYKFIEDSIYLLVIIDMKVVKSLFKSRGVHSTFLQDSDYILQICKNSQNFDEGVFRISRNLFLRIPYEFQSLEWFVNEHSLVFESELVNGSEGRPLYEIPESWFSVRDYLDDIEV